MSASTLVDLGNSCQLGFSLGVSGTFFSASGGVIGEIVDLVNANTFCNVFAQGRLMFTSGQLRLAVQTADATTSGTFTDPTSGLPVMPTSFVSGGIIWLNSGQASGGLFGAFTSGQAIQSGWAVAAGFQRPHRYARVNMLSGDFYAGTLTAGFITSLKTTGSGGGTTQSPGSGTVSV